MSTWKMTLEGSVLIDTMKITIRHGGRKLFVAAEVVFFIQVKKNPPQSL